MYARFLTCKWNLFILIRNLSRDAERIVYRLPQSDLRRLDIRAARWQINLPIARKSPEAIKTVRIRPRISQMFCPIFHALALENTELQIENLFSVYSTNDQIKAILRLGS